MARGFGRRQSDAPGLVARDLKCDWNRAHIYHGSTGAVWQELAANVLSNRLMI